MKQHLQLICMFLLLSWSTMGQTYIYVKHDASGSNNGTSWTDAYTSLQSALSAASTDFHILVAAGTYEPSNEAGGSGTRYRSFQLKNGVELYGGFTGNEDPATFNLNNRDFVANETILSGVTDEVYHVFRHINIGLNNTAVLDGFTISGGKADGADPDNKGGGMLNSGSSSGNGSSPTIVNCIFKNNKAGEGGAIYNSRYSSPAISNTAFSDNSASTKGGAVFNTRNTPTFSHCTFTGNETTGSSANDGGGAMYNNAQTAAEGVVISNCIFTNNSVPTTGTATYGGGAIFSSLDPGKLEITSSSFYGNTGKYGGAIYHRSGNDSNRDNSAVSISQSNFYDNNAEYGGAIFSDRHHTIVTSTYIRGNEAAEQAGGFYSRYASSEIVNSLISGNKSGKHGGGVYFNTETPKIINTTISGNYSGERGGGISIIGGSVIAFNNNVLYGNASPEGSELWICGTCTTNSDYSLYGNASGDVFITTGGNHNVTNSSTSDPMFLNPLTPSSANTPNTSGNYMIKSTSPAVDAGNNTYLPAGVTYDLHGRDRIIDGNNNSSGVIDMGAYEYDPDYCNANAPSIGDGSVENPYQISTLGHLCWLSQNSSEWSKHIIQIAEIDASDTEFWDDGKGFTPIGNSTTKFTGTYNGKGYDISNLTINRATSNEIGLFGDIGQASGYRATVQNLTLVNASVTGKDQVGLLAGRANRDIDFINCHVSGSVQGNRNVGGMVGDVNHSDFLYCSSSATVGVNNQADVRYHGGLIGLINGSSSVVKQSYATGSVTGASRIGGLVGAQGYNTTIENCYATGNVYPTISIQTSPMIGGLVGEVYQAKLRYSFSTGAVYITGLTGQYGGLAGAKNNTSPFADVDNFWDTQTSGLTTSELGTGKTTAEMKTQATFTNWDFVNIWAISPATNNGHPNLDGKSAITWNGNTNSDWATESNWSTGSLPTVTDDVIIPGAANPSIIDFATTASCNHLVIESGGKLTVEGTLDNSGTVTVNSDASASGSLILNGTLTGNVTYNRYLVNDRWHLISSPVAGQTFNSTFFAYNSIDHNPGSTEFALIDYDTETNQWNPYPGADASGTFTSAKGFLMARYVDSSDGGTVGFTGTVATSAVSFSPLTAGYRWNAVGNPFPSAIGINPNAGTDNFIDKNLSNLDESFTAIYYWDDTQGISGDYIAINKSDETAFYAAPGQGFFVKAASESTVINFPVSLRTHQGSVTLKSGQAEWPQLEIAAKSGDARSVATIKFVEGSTPGLDAGYDAGKFKSNPEINLFTKLVDDNGVDFGLQCLPPTQMESLAIPVGLDVKTAGEVTFSINYSSLPGNLIPVLEDRLLNIKTPFETGNNNYTSTVNESESDYGRFYISFSSTTNVAQLKNGPFFKAWYSNNTIQIQGNGEGAAVVTLYDINGRALMQKKVTNESQNSLSIPNLSNGIYLVKIAGSNKTELLKVPVLK